MNRLKRLHVSVRSDTAWPPCATQSSLSPARMIVIRTLLVAILLFLVLSPVQWYGALLVPRGMSHEVYYWSGITDQNQSILSSTVVEPPQDKDLSHRILYLLDLDQTHSHEPSFCRVRFEKITMAWTASAFYQDLLHACRRYGEYVTLSSLWIRTGGGGSIGKDPPPIRTIIFHQVPKTASTSMRIAILNRNRDGCGEQAKFPHTGCDTLREILFNSCGLHEQRLQSFIHDTLVRMPKNLTTDSSGQLRRCFDYSRHAMSTSRWIVHAIPVRNFKEWASSALRQDITRVEERRGAEHVPVRCQAYRNKFAQCQPGMREITVGGYSKWILQRVIQHTPISDPIFLYDYVNTTWIMTSYVVREMGQAPYDMSRRYKDQPNNSTCPNDVLKLFHGCFDDLLHRIS